MRSKLVPLLLLFVACSAATTKVTPGRPAVDLRQVGTIFFGSGTTAPINIAVAIQNVAADPIVVRRVRIEGGPGMAQYSVYPAERTLAEKLAPGEVKELNIVATAYTNVARLSPTEPLSMRAFIDYDAGGTRHRELYQFRSVSE